MSLRIPAVAVPTVARRTMLVLGLTTTSMSLSGIVATSALAGTRCVGKGAGCFATVQGALDAAQDGETIRIEAGTFAGGATVRKSVVLVGAGQTATVLSGGGPVLTIGTLFDDSPPVVSIRDLTITGGRTTSSVLSDFRGQPGVRAFGGGIDIPPGEDFTPGATVTLTRTNITANRVAPVAAIDSTLPCPGGADCPFAVAAGGGIYNWGNLTISDSTVSGNRVGSASGVSALASDAEGGGIYSRDGSLTIVRSRIEDNLATATAPNGRFADGGGVFDFDSPFTMRDSSVSGNSAHLDAGLPNSVETLAVAGGVHITDNVPAGLIVRSEIAHNSVGITNTVGDAIAFTGGLHVDPVGTFKIADSLISDNRVSAATLGTSAGFAFGGSGGAQLYGRMSSTRVVDNVVTATAPSGDAEAIAGGFWALSADVSDSRVRGNRLAATAPNGQARVRGAGAVVDTPDPEHPELGVLRLTDSAVSENVGSATGQSSLGQGGGIFDAALPDGPFGGPLTLVDSTVKYNVLIGGPGATLQGGGVFLDGGPLTRTNSVIAGNLPDQCFGC